MTARDDYNAVAGAYANVRAYWPVYAGLNLLLEAGMHWMNVYVEPSNEPFSDEAYSAYVHGGVEWRW